MIDLERNTVCLADNLPLLRELPDESIPLVYIDPPFNTGKTQSRTSITVERDEDGDRTGFGGRRYRTREVISRAWEDEFDDYLGFLEPRLVEAHRVLAADGSLYFHIDYREVHYVKVLLDAIFGRESFINEIIWAYDYGGRSKKRWPAKHDNILLYAKDPDDYVFNREEVDRIPYMAPGLVSEEKREKGKFPTDTWWHTIVSPTGSEKTGYPTQKPLGILKRVVAASSKPGDLVLDFFAGSGTTGAAALELGRRFCLVDNNPEAFEVMRERFAGEQPQLGVEVEFVEW